MRSRENRRTAIRRRERSRLEFVPRARPVRRERYAARLRSRRRLESTLAAAGAGTAKSADAHGGNGSRGDVAVRIFRCDDMVSAMPEK